MFLYHSSTEKSFTKEFLTMIKSNRLEHNLVQSAVEELVPVLAPPTPPSEMGFCCFQRKPI